MGEMAGGPLYAFQLADRLNEPVHTPWDAWGNRIDQIEVSPLWRAAEQLAARSGLIATALRAQARGVVADASDGARVPVHALHGCVQLPARDDGRCRTHAQRVGQCRPARARVASSHVPRSAPVLDQRPVDDREHRRLGRGALRDARAAGRAGQLAAVRPQVVHLRGNQPDGAHAGAARGEPGGRQGTGAVLSRDARCPGAARSHPGAPIEGQARHAQGAHRRAHPRWRPRPAGHGSERRGEEHLADAQRDAHVEQREQRGVYAPRHRARPRLRAPALRLRCDAGARSLCTWIRSPECRRSSRRRSISASSWSS